MSIVETTETDSPGAAQPAEMESKGMLGVFGQATLWLWLDRGGLRIGTAIAGLLLVRYLGPANYGIYTTALAYGALMGALLDFGLTLRAAREVGVQPEEGKRIIAAYLAVTAVAFIPQLLFIAITAILGHVYLAAIGIGFLFVNSDTTVDFCRQVLTSELRAKETLPGSVLSAFGTIAVVAMVITLRLTVWELLILMSLKSLSVACLRLWQIRNLWPSRENFRVSTMKATLVRSWHFYSYTLTQIGYERVSIICLALVATRYEVGLFGAAVTIASIYPQWSYATSDAVLPLLTRLFEYGRWNDLIELRQRLLDVLLFISVPVAVLICVFAPQICGLFGARFAGSTVVLRIVAYRSVISVLDGFLGQAFLPAIGRVKERRNAQLRAIAIVAILIFPLGHYWGAVGAGIALLVADATLFLQYLPICGEAKLAVTWPALWPSMGAGAVMALAAVYLPHMFWMIKVFPCLLIYAGMLLLLGRHRVFEAGGTLRECLGGA